MVKVKLQSSDEKIFEVEKEIACMSLTIKGMLDANLDESDAEIPLNNVNAEILEKIIEYCKHHHENPTNTTVKAEENEESFDDKFIKVEHETLFQLTLAANFLDIKPLLDLTCKQIANLIRGKTPEEIKHTFNLTQDFTPEEEEQIRKENEWCEDRNN
ncbi:hypothetical protein CYY_001967 [Polysphondylium violaceum]|uniref:Cytosolic glycoprotein FP21 n=1 Tax=Polysphondylium violaceum TaxID=133409 RepID=A0A8J4V153_9MYCE|nr:hypothetical protein CYY_001967 [Polysphondylium violaceum]